MNYREFIREMSKLEAGKAEVKVGNMREVFKKLKALLKKNPEALEFLVKYLGLKVSTKL